MLRAYFFSSGWLIAALFFLTGCQSVTGNVVPQQGPSMESVYDSMGVASPHKALPANSKAVDNASMAEADLTSIRSTRRPQETGGYSSSAVRTSSTTIFKKLPNPELQLYVYPHLTGTDEIPIPGYYTALSAYEKTHYALPEETAR